MAKKLNSEIKISVGVDENNVPEAISWTAKDGGVNNEATKAVMLSVWDHKAQESLRIDLWTKDMPDESILSSNISLYGKIISACNK
eukprot:CAMPEP_0178990022 /NCGR_PEP_ID=MMETSP0795-20121207/4699_1 /TAXON_ID=88552 /ORGANISM="Amoebophrya sp., Strain Ameob2" /LENGTH=85 /DNA_ID=CAMNT_0020681489 /DNA_START=1008 /DNA_END=1265 /DNA_ORIENTATION=+